VIRARGRLRIDLNGLGKRISEALKKLVSSIGDLNPGEVRLSVSRFGPKTVV
jgi:hypothetical protein